MEYQKNTNLLDTTSNNVPRLLNNGLEFMISLVNKPSRPIRFKTSMRRSDLCDYSDAYIVVKGTVTVADPNNNAYNKKLAFKNNAQFISCILKINNTLIDNPKKLETL